MDMLNMVCLMGRLVRDPVVTYMQNSSGLVARFTLAVEKSYKSGEEWQTKTSYISCVAWNKTGEFVEKHFRQGNMVCVNGSIETGSYTDKNGNKVYTTDVIVNNAYFTGEKRNAEESAPSAPDNEGFMNIPDGIEEELPFN